MEDGRPARFPMRLAAMSGDLIAEARALAAELEGLRGSILGGGGAIAGAASELAVERVLRAMGVPVRRVRPDEQWSEHDLVVERPYHRVEVKATQQAGDEVPAHYMVNINLRDRGGLSPLQRTDLYVFTRTSHSGARLAIMGWDTIERVASYGLAGSPWVLQPAGTPIGNGKVMTRDCLSCNVGSLTDLRDLPGFLRAAGGRGGFAHSENIALCQSRYSKTV